MTVWIDQRLSARTENEGLCRKGGLRSAYSPGDMRTKGRELTTCNKNRRDQENGEGRGRQDKSSPRKIGGRIKRIWGQRRVKVMSKRRVERVA